MFKKIAELLISKAEKRIGVEFDYAREIARTDLGLMARYGKIFSFLDPNKKTPALAYHVARLRGAISADCGTCVQAEINLARQAQIDTETIHQVLRADYAALPTGISAVARLADAVVGAGQDDPDARAQIEMAFGRSGLIELSFAMNGAALLPGIKRAMGYATVCDLEMLQLKG